MKLRKIQIFAGSKKELAIHIFFTENKENPNSITSDVLDVIYPGLPQTPTFTQIEGFVSEKRSIAYVHYYGSWYSGGTFTPSTIEESVKDSISVLEEGIVEDVYNEQTIKVSVNKINLIGNSLGAYFLYKFKTEHNKILLSPLLPIQKDGLISSDLIEVLEKIKKSIASYKKSLLYCYRGIVDNSWDYFVNKIIEEKKKQNENATIYIGTKDNLISKQYILDCLDTNFDYTKIKEVDFGHDFYQLYNAYITDTEGK